MLGPCPSVYDCLWPSQSVGLPPNPSSPASYMPYKSECVCVYVLAFLSVSVCMFWLVFYYSVNQISCLTTQSKHLQHAPWTRTWTWPRAGPLYHPLITAQPLLHTPAHPHTHTHSPLIFFILLICLLCVLDSVLLLFLQLSQYAAVKNNT